MVSDVRGSIRVSYIVVDTCVLIRLEGEYFQTKDCILASNDTIAYSDEAMKEYEARAHASPLILQSFLQELHGKGKLKHFKRSFIRARVERLENSRNIHYPNHSKDKKWVKLAVAIGAGYILSTNGHLLELPLNRCNDHCVRAIPPSDYVNIRCPDIA
jgi:predicted nucleic acid-binding protein